MKSRRTLYLVLGGMSFVALLAVGLILPTLRRDLARAQKQNCLSSMVSIGLAGRMWASEHDDHFPRTLTEMSNECSSPRVLICAAAPEAQQLRRQMGSWGTFDERRSSYEVANPGASETNQDTVFFRCKIHGHLGYVDGSIFDGTRRLSSSEAKGGSPAP